MLHNSTETIILPSPSMKLEVDMTTLRDGPCIDASVQGCDLCTSSKPQFLWFCFPKKQKC